MSNHPLQSASQVVPRHPGIAEALARKLDRSMGVLGVLFVLVILGQSLARVAVVAAQGALPDAMEVVPATYLVAVFASLAAALGAFFLAPRDGRAGARVPEQAPDA